MEGKRATWKQMGGGKTKIYNMHRCGRGSHQKEKREAGIVNTLKGWIGKNDVEKSIPDVVNRIW